MLNSTGNQAQYIRGTPSALTKHFGSNLNIPLRPLRLALYLRLRKQGLLADKTSIVEVFPNWNVHLGAFEWHRHVVDLHSLCAQTPQATLVSSWTGHACCKSLPTIHGMHLDWLR